MTGQAGAARFRSAAIGFLALALAGCAAFGPTPPRTEHQTQLGRVAIVAAARTPEFKFEGFAHGKGEGAALGAGSTFASCLAATGQGGCSGSACGAMLVLVLGICSVAGLVGGVAGATAAPSADAAQAAQFELARAVEVRTVQQALRDRVEAAALSGGVQLILPAPAPTDSTGGSDYGAGAETVLETALVEVGTEGHGINAPVMAYMKSHVRLVRTADQSELLAADFVYLGRRLTIAEWSANRGAALLREIETGYETLGRHIYESVFELYPLPDRDVHSAGGMLSTAVGLAPLDPPTRGQLSGDRLIGSTFEWTAVETLRPTLRWQAFPRPTDVARAPEDMARVRNVRYDLVVAREQNLAPAEIVYRREGLPNAEHALEITLGPGTRYFWTMRARFELDGRQRLTEWGSTQYMAREQFTAPSRFSYRFRTPGSH